MPIYYATTANELKKLIARNPKVIVDFWASFCAPCKYVGPYFEELSTKYPNVTFVKASIEDPEISSIADEYGVASIPTFLTFHGGVLTTAKLVGANKENLLQLVATLDQNN